jgi:hypothetical protein
MQAGVAVAASLGVILGVVEAVEVTVVDLEASVAAVAALMAVVPAEVGNKSKALRQF